MPSPIAVYRIGGLVGLGVAALVSRWSVPAAVSVSAVAITMALWIKASMNAPIAQRAWSRGPPVVVVTGANKGIGLAIVRTLCTSLGADATVVLTARNQTLGEEAVASLRRDGLSNVVFCQLDITKPDSVAAAKLWVEKTVEGGAVDALVCNAGFAYKVSATEPFAEQARNTVDINYYGTKRVMDAFLPLLQKRKGAEGRVVCVSSRAGRMRATMPQEVR